MASQTSSNANSSTATTDESGSRMGSAYRSARATAASAGRTLGNNPVGAMIGGFTVGAVLGAVMPSSRREREALQPIGLKVSEAARGAARNAAETGRDKLNRLTGEVVTQVGSKVVDAVAPPKE